MQSDAASAAPVLFQSDTAGEFGRSAVLRAVKWFCGALFFVLFVIMVLEVTNRFYDVLDIRWSEEISRTLLIWFVFIGFGLASAADQNIKVDLIGNLQLGPLRRLLTVLSAAATFAFLIALVVFGVQLSLVGGNTRMVSLDLSMAFVLAAVPVGAALGIALLLVRLVRALAVRTSVREFP
jgi:TRAP-type C4-dicarboxylate transport system permease small subunit